MYLVEKSRTEMSGFLLQQTRQQEHRNSNIFKRTEGKNERGYRLKANHFSSWSRPLKVISDVPVSRNLYKTVSNLYEISYYIQFWIEIVSLNRLYSANTQPIWKQRYPQRTRIVTFLQLLFNNFYFYF